MINNIEFIKSKGIDVYIVQAPITKTLYKSINNNKDVDRFLSNLGNYKNYQNLIELKDSTDFFDNNHLNQIGVEKFNTVLSKDLTNILKK